MIAENRLNIKQLKLRDFNVFRLQPVPGPVQMPWTVNTGAEAYSERYVYTWEMCSELNRPQPAPHRCARTILVIQSPHVFDNFIRLTHRLPDRLHTLSVIKYFLINTSYQCRLMRFKTLLTCPAKFVCLENCFFSIARLGTKQIFVLGLRE